MDLKQLCSPRPDRFIPPRENINIELSNHLLTKNSQNGTPPLVKDLQKKILNDGKEVKILSLKQKPPLPSSSLNENRVLYSYAHNSSKTLRSIPTHPELTLEAPNIEDDFYMNLLDWSCENIIAIGLQNEVFFWNGNTSLISKICCTPPSVKVTSVKWAPDGHHIAVGNDTSTVQLWDTRQMKLIRTLKSHPARVCSLNWNQCTLSTGSKDCSIINHDVRMRTHALSTWIYHSSEVCGLEWSPKGHQLACGANDNVVSIWDARNISDNLVKPLFALTAHRAAVKALSWAPFQSNLLATGGGSGDRHLRFWNTQTGCELNSIDTGSQVCSVKWANNSSKELVTSHGFSKNQLIVWKYPSLAKISGNLVAHTQRVLHLSLSPDSTTVASAAGDEKLCFWKIFTPKSEAFAPGESRAASSSKKMNNVTSLR